MVFSGLYPIDGSDYPELRDALDRLSSTTPPWSTSRRPRPRSGFGFRCGFLGLLHLEIVRERLEREFNLDLISTAPERRLPGDHGRRHAAHRSPTRASTPTGKIAEVREPVVRATILRPTDYIGAIMELCQTRRGNLLGMDYLSEDRVELRYTLPLAEIVFDFFDALKSRTRGYASLDYETHRRAGRRPGQGRHPAARRAGRRVLRDRAQGQGLRLRRGDGRQAQGADPAPAVRGADPGRDRRRASSPARTSGPSARTCSPSATAVTSPASASCWRSRRRARSG